MTSADDILLGAALPEDTVPICTRGDLVAEFKRVGRQLVEERARAAADPRLAGTGSGLEALLEQLRGQVQAATVTFRVRALDRKAWAVLVDEHPPRIVQGKLHEDDQAGVNNETFFPALIKACTVEPVLQDATWEKLLDEHGPLSDGQYHTLARTCWNLNKRDVNIPFSYAALLQTAASSPDSEPPAPSESASNGSTAGNPAE